MKLYLKLTEVQPRHPELRFSEPVNWSLMDGEVWAVVGPNGSGKSTLANLIAGKLAMDTHGRIEYHFGTAGFKAWRDVQILAFDSVYGLADFRETYYQQRFHSTQNAEMPSVGEILQPYAGSPILGLFGVDRFWQKKVNYLSSGELRKFLITKSLLAQPKLLIIDNPYIGLDAASRQVLKEALQNLSGYAETKIMFILSDQADIPGFVTHILPIEQMRIGTPYLYQEAASTAAGELPDFKKDAMGQPPIVELRNISIRYGENQIIRDIDWRIGRGEKWVLTGANGSGKSTLLNLIHADHPQGYANDIVLFGRKRGSGESIWDIKKRIGYISPEMHTHYYQNIPAIEVVASGLFDTIGTVYKCNEEQAEKSLRWMERFGISDLQNRSFMRLSSGEQRLVLLARTFVKEPELLILDEPLHGLDARNKRMVLHIIEAYAADPAITLIYVTHYLNEIPKLVTHRFQL